jgi:serine/threonine-protein kinase
VDLRAWDRYEIGEELGTGATGRVYKAWDPRLCRAVAIKLLRADDEDQRFVREARAQASIEHENVCKVYEVGEVFGRPYLALQYVGGPTLRQAASDMAIRDKVDVVRKVALAIEAAHQRGLIHRDIKPSNVLVERTDAGEFRPYVTDFGLARAVETQGVTKSGTAIGTPSYMSPEQVRGHAAEVDQRSDVYGLGATMYELFAGRPPFEGPNAPAVLLDVLDRDPVPLEGVPEDVATIVMRCLEKDAARRYPTAQALADDLGRFLAGEPIRARPQSLTYRLRRRARKHRAAFALGASALAAVAVLGLLIWQSRHGASERAELAQTFGQEVEHIDALMSAAVLLPLHDIGREKAEVRARMAAIARQMDEIGPSAQGPGHYALGRGRLALREFQAAHKELETAWAAGYQAPEVACALATTLSEEYRFAFKRNQHIAGDDARRKNREEIERTLRDPALRYLRLCGSSGYLEGRIALLEDRRADALAKARAAQAPDPMTYPAIALEGDVLLADAVAARNRGDLPTAAQALEGAEAAYGRAREIARSDAMLASAQCAVGYDAMDVAASQGKPLGPMFDRAARACADALQIDPENGVAQQDNAELYWRWAEYQAAHGENPQQSLERSVAHAERAAALLVPQPGTFDTIGNACATRAEWESKRGGDPRPWLDRAITAYEKALALNPRSHQSNSNICLGWEDKAEWEMAHRIDPAPSLDRAAAACQHALDLKPDYWSGWNNLGNVLDARAEWEARGGRDPRPLLARAVDAYGRAIAAKPLYRYFSNRAGSELQAAAWEVSHGEDPAPAIERALASAESAASRKADHAPTWVRIATARRIEAAWKVAHGADAGAALTSARQAAEKALAIDKTFGPARLALAETELVAARPAKALQILSGLDDPDAARVRAQAHLRLGDRVRARQEIDRALAAFPRQPESLAVAAQLTQ